jgi:hypothetical protein
MVETGAVARKTARDLTQARCPGKLAVEQGDELLLGAEPPHLLVRSVLGDQIVEPIPRNAL